MTAGPALSREPSIAVIVPNYNDARYLPRCLRSVLDQAVGPDELIVVDDKSTDDSVAAIRSLIAGQAHARLVENPVNLGVYGAVDEGLRQTHSEYALFLAANDFVLPGIFARARACLARSPGLGLWSAMAWMVDEEDRPIRLHPSAVVSARDAQMAPEQCIRLAWRHGNWFTGTTLIYNRKALAEAGGFDPAYGGLSDLITALVVASRHGAAYSPEPFAAIRIHSGSVLSQTLLDPLRVEQMLDRLNKQDYRRAPDLFSDAFLERTAQRFRFAAVRASRGASLAEVAKNAAGWKGALLRLLASITPRALVWPRVVIAFLVLRPYDLLPSLWSRALGWLLVRARSRFVGETPQ
jgi:glycosyltransferase involved in cell wall biosynthesis